MVQWVIETLRKNPEIAIFLVLALGFLMGSLRVGKFTLGNVTGVLLAGVIVGQLHIDISANVKSVFFLMFLFAVGYNVGPQFFRGLKKDGLPQVLFAIVVCTACLLATYIAAKLARYSAGQAAGLLSGACTISAVLGVATDTINSLAIPEDQKKVMIDAMPVAYAVTYFFGTAGSAWFLASVGPKLLRVDLVKECKEYEEKQGGKTQEGLISANWNRVIRAYEMQAGSRFLGMTIGRFEQSFAPKRVWIQRVRQMGNIREPDESIVIQPGDVIVAAAERQVLLDNQPDLGREVEDPELLDFPLSILDVVITSKTIAGLTLKQLADSDIGKEGRGIFLRKLIRAGHEIPFTASTVIDRGDVLQIMGATRDVERTAKVLGYPDRATEKTDVVFMGLGIAIGAIIGAIVIHFGTVPISLSTSGGALFAGLFCGWLRSVHPTFGRIPAPALWAFNNLGLTVFIAVVGITTGPKFVQGLQQAGLSLFLWGVFVTTLPFVIGIYVGKYLFKMHPGILLGACAGARTTTAALGLIQDEAKSKVPALGYTVPYAVGCILLIIWGVVIVLLTK